MNETQGPCKCVGVQEHVCAAVCVFACGFFFFFLRKDFPLLSWSCVCAGAILSCSRDCNEQLAAHQALSLGPGFPGRSPGPVDVSVRGWGGCRRVPGNRRAGLSGSPGLRALCLVHRKDLSSCWKRVCVGRGCAGSYNSASSLCIPGTGHPCL